MEEKRGEELGRAGEEAKEHGKRRAAPQHGCNGEKSSTFHPVRPVSGVWGVQRGETATHEGKKAQERVELWQSIVQFIFCSGTSWPGKSLSQCKCLFPCSFKQHG